MDTGTIIMAIITAISVIVAIYSVVDSQRRYIDSILPVISLKLSPSNNWLNLEVLNSGKSAAHNISISIRNIECEEIDYVKENDYISGLVFDLFPEEIVCNHIAKIDGIRPNPVVFLDISYIDEGDELHCYSRTLSIYNEE